MITVALVLTAVFGVSVLANRSPNKYGNLTIGGIAK